MRFFLIFSLCCLSNVKAVYAQLWPREGDTLHYRIVGFSFPADEKATGYSLEIAKGYCSDETSFLKNRIKTSRGNTNKMVAEVPAFGAQYSWRIAYLQNAKVLNRSAFHHFSTGMIHQIDTTNIKIKVTQKATKFEDAYFFMDGGRALFDMAGNPVWYVPNKEGVIRETSLIRDIKLSSKGTITFLMEGDAYEMNYNGDMLWKGPGGRNRNGDTTEGYHHDMARLSNGHYMVLGFEPRLRRRPMQRDSVTHKVNRDTAIARLNATNKRMRYGTIMEYDEQSNVVWSWNAAKYFETQDLGIYNTINGVAETDIHENSFYFDEVNSVIYVSFRNVSQILKVSYPDGKVLNAYGRIDAPGMAPGNGLFCGQHSCRRSSEGYLYLFNNGCSLTHPPSVVMVKEPATADKPLEKIWEYICPVDTTQNIHSNMLSRKVQFTSGGSINELPDHSFLVSTCIPYSKVFIVSRDKQILWGCEAYKWMESRNEWVPLPQYRTSFVSGIKDIETLIWSGFQR